MSATKIVIAKPETNFYATAPQPQRAAKPVTRPETLDSFLECRSTSALGCFAESVAKGFVIGLTSPLWLATACGESTTYEAAIALEDDATGDSQRRVAADAPDADKASDAALPDTTGSDSTRTPPDADAAVEADATPVEDADAMSTPDDGMSLIDTEDGDATIPQETDASTEADATPVEDADAMSTPDDGMSLIDANDADAAIPQDADDAADSNDIGAPQDANDAVDQSGDVTPACTPNDKCAPVCITQTEEVTITGAKTAYVKYLVKGDSIECNGKSQAIPGAPDGNGTLELPVTAKDQSFATNCVVKGAGLIAKCEDAKVTVTPNKKPIVKTLTPNTVGILPGGDQCFKVTNTLEFKFEASDPDTDPISCAIEVFTKDGKSIQKIDAPANKMSVQLAAGLLQPKTDYSWQVNCTDGGPASLSDFTSFTTSEKGLIGWWRFDEKDGALAHDSSGNGLDGTLIGFDPLTAWQNGSLLFNGTSNYVILNNNPNNNIASLRFLLKFTPNQLQKGFQSIIDKMGSQVDHRIFVEIIPEGKIGYGACTPNVPCIADNVPQSKQPISTQPYIMSGIFDGTSISLFINNTLESTKINQSSTVPTTNPFIFGNWAAGINKMTANRFFSGYIDEIVLSDYNAECK